MIYVVPVTGPGFLLGGPLYIYIYYSLIYTGWKNYPIICKL